ncbi:MAG: hypothetical protein HPY69_11955 [Armatimonadetes bacterium]|nr:hypothetical protein [Armatimonadota bacterium]
MELCLVHTADLHNRLDRRRAQRLRELKQERRAVLLDCGDALAAPNILAFPWSEPAIRWLNEAGCDAMCLGNREYAWYRSGLLRKTGEARFPVLATNLVPRPGQDPGHLRRWTVLTSPDGVRLGVLGLTEVMVQEGTMVSRLAIGRFLDPLVAAREAVTALRPQVDVLIALTHYGRAEEAALAGTCPELDAILCGHWHVSQPSLEVVGRTAVARTFHHGRGASIMTLADGKWRQEAFRL